MKKALLIIVLLFVVLLSSCGETKHDSIVTTMFPQYDIAKKLVGDKYEVSLLTPFGSEIHDFTPSAKALVEVNESSLFIYTSDIIEPWISDISNLDSINSLDLSSKITVDSSVSELDYLDDPHYWTDPYYFIQMIQAVRDSLISLDPDNKEIYTSNANNYIDEIELVSSQLASFIATVEDPYVFFAGHNSLLSFSRRFNFEVRSLSNGFHPDDDLTPNQMISIIDEIKSRGISYLFIEELVEPKAAETIKNELAKEDYSLTLLELHSFHNITKEQNDEGASYATILKQNYENLKVALSN